MTEKTSDFLMKLADLIGDDRKSVMKKIEGLDVDQMIDLLDAVNSGDASRVSDIIGQNESLDDETDGPVVSGGDEADDETAYDATIGDEVTVNGKEGKVKIAKAPNDTVGVIIDGKLTMVKARDVKPIKEHVLGMTPMGDLRRMQELAGIASMPAEEMPVAMAAPTERPQVQVVRIEDIQPLSIGEIMASFVEIERSLPELKVKDAKDVRARLNQLMGKLNESHKRV